MFFESRLPLQVPKLLTAAQQGNFKGGSAGTLSQRGVFSDVGSR